MAEVPFFPPPPSYSPPRSTKSSERSYFNFRRGRPDRPFLNHLTLAQQVEPSDVEQPGLPRLDRRSSWRLCPSSRLWTWIDEWWLWELASWAFSATCLLAIAVILAVYKGHQLPAWPLGLTLNAYVSILGAFAKAGLLLPTAEALGQLKYNWFAGSPRDVSDFQTFDQASRGPWGSLMLIFRTRGKALAALGASVIVLSIALDPFFQQVLFYPTRMAFVGQSKILRSRMYSANLYAPPARQNGESFVYQDFPVTFYVAPGLYYNVTPKEPEIPTECASGNCTWPPYETLAACSTCVDISDLLRYACLESENDWFSNVINGTASTFTHGHSCGYYLNSTGQHPKLMSGVGHSSNNNETLIGRALPLNFPDPAGRTYFNSQGSINFRHLPDAIVDALFVFTPGGYNGVHSNNTPIALECNLHWCIQTLDSSIQNGTLQETILDTFENITEQVTSSNWTLEANQTGAYNFNHVPTLTSPRTGDAFGVNSNLSAFTLSITFMETTYAFATSRSAEDPPIYRYTELGTSNTMVIPFDTTPWFDGINISSQFQRTAHAITSLTRSVSNGTEAVVGTAWGPQTFVSIRWEWLSLPITLLAVSLVFLLAAIAQSHAKGIDIWKTSVLAVLLHGLPTKSSAADSCIREHSPRPSSCLDSIHLGDTPTFVRLRGKRGRWRFSMTSSKRELRE